MLCIASPATARPSTRRPPHPTHPGGLPSCVRCVVHAPQVFALSEEVGQWLLVDDEHAQLVGQWPDVVKAMAAKRLQPSLLFFEQEDESPPEDAQRP